LALIGRESTAPAAEKALSMEVLGHQRLGIAIGELAPGGVLKLDI
jgi:hypothetical protein